MNRQTPPWYENGLCFSCTQCGHCCRLEGHVWVNREEIEAIARHLELEPDAFGRRFLRRVGSRVSLTEKPNQDCVFWDDGCSIYPVRPGQCRTFPFWGQNLRGPRSWKGAAVECEGIGEGRLYTLSEIELLRCGRGSTADGAPKTDARRAPLRSGDGDADVCPEGD